MNIFLFFYSLFPLAIVGEFVAAIFSKRVRAFIVKHPVVHTLWFGLAILSVLLLLPMSSGPNHRY